MGIRRRTRRAYLAGAGALAAGVVLKPALAAMAREARDAGLKVGMCDWSMRRLDVTSFERAREIGLDGVEVSIGFAADNLKLRRPEVQQMYLEAARKTGVEIPSVAMGVLNDVPLMSEPRAALWVADTIEATERLGAKIILLAFFGKGELKEENKEDMRRVTEALRELAPRAQAAGVILGLETYLRAEAHLEIIEAVGSPAVRVYYDVYNANHREHDILREIRLLGREYICQVHFKEGPALLGSGKIPWPEVVAALKEVGYDGWAILETSSPNDVVEDSRRNMQYLRRLFREAGRS